MPENNALPSYGETSSIGNFMFAPVEGVNENHLENLKRLDAAQAEHQKTQQAKLGLINKMTGDIDVDYKGLLPHDQEAIKKETDALVDLQTQFLQAGGDPQKSPSQYSTYNKAMMQVKQHVALANTRTQMLKAYRDMANADAKGAQKLNQDKAAAGIAKLMVSDWDALGNTDWQSEILQEQAEPLGKMLDGIVKSNFAKDKASTDNVQVGGDYFYQKEHHENFTPEQGRSVAKAMTSNSYPNSKESVDKAWLDMSTTTPEVAKQLVDANIAKGQSQALAEQNAKEDFVYNQMMDIHHSEQTKYKFLSETPQSKLNRTVGAGNAKLAAKGVWLYDAAKALYDENSTAATNVSYKPVFNTSASPLMFQGISGVTGKKLGTYTEPVLDKDGKQAFGQNGEALTRQVPNVLVVAGKDPNSGKVFVVTSESQAAAKKSGKSQDEFINFAEPQDFMTYLGDKSTAGTTDGAILIAKQNKEHVNNKTVFNNKPQPTPAQKSSQVITQTKLTPSNQPKTASGKKEYTKAQLAEKAKAAGYTYEEYYDLVKDKVTVK